MCTSLSYRDAAGKVYFGRTLELTQDLPYQVMFIPSGTLLTSEVSGHPSLDYAAKHDFLAVAMPDRIPSSSAPMGVSDLKTVEGMNAEGLTFSVLSYPTAGGEQASVEATLAVLAASDLGTWALSQFATVEELKVALNKQPVMLEMLALLGNVESPFHYVAHDAVGGALVIEFDRGQLNIYDNPVGVMTNGPSFDWHLTNLDNYTFLTNVDKTSANFGTYRAVQPDSGIATAGLPASNTSVGRFVRAAYYSEYTEKASTPDLAVQTLAHIMNNFDRPRGVTIDFPSESTAHLAVPGLTEGPRTAYATEFTCWTNLSDLERKQFFLRTYQSINYTRFDLASLAGIDGPRVLAFAQMNTLTGDSTDRLKEAKCC
ncbi:MAG: linear amide C-N hydrolase [Halomonas sp.]|uniref:linear amide C-N hydrolase n=1 Tax=Halomonas sp. TaxID=1486246 RepID=UPI003F91AF73